MKYTYTITSELICDIKNDNVTVDISGPWESEASAIQWASSYVNQLNSISNEEDLDVSN